MALMNTTKKRNLKEQIYSRHFLYSNTSNKSNSKKVHSFLASQAM